MMILMVYLRIFYFAFINGLLVMQVFIISLIVVFVNIMKEKPRLNIDFTSPLPNLVSMSHGSLVTL